MLHPCGLVSPPRCGPGCDWFNDVDAILNHLAAVIGLGSLAWSPWTCYGQYQSWICGLRTSDQCHPAACLSPNRHHYRYLLNLASGGYYLRTRTLRHIHRASKSIGSFHPCGLVSPPHCSGNVLVAGHLYRTHSPSGLLYSSCLDWWCLHRG
jgi:hypothetical protein